VAGGHDAAGDGCDLLRCFAEPENNLGKALPGSPVVVDARESQVLERGLAYKLKESDVRRLRCYRA
jgi:hypothetical protein